jgi:RHS repeat-associated protein
LTQLFNYNSNTLKITSGFEFNLDADNNRSIIKRKLPLSQPQFNLASSAYAYNSANQLISATGKTFSYDDNGNLTRQIAASITTNFTYDFDNQLIRYVTGALDIAYQYDVLGNRIKKTEGSAVTKYIVDPNRSLPSVLEETNASGAVSAYYVYGLGLISKIVGSNAYFYQYDGLGSTVALSAKTGSIKNKYAYDDFGNLATNSVEAIPNTFKYVGRFGVMTDVPDLLYMRARYYMPSIGRFINKDPIGGLNSYSYTNNNPINYIDPFGLWYIDFNFSGGWWGGITIGFVIGSEGIYKYVGAGVVTPGISGSIMWSPQSPTSGWNISGGGVCGIGFQGGYSIGKGGSRFWEIGIGWFPGGGATVYYVSKPWMWPWKRR